MERTNKYLENIQFNCRYLGYNSGEELSLKKILEKNSVDSSSIGLTVVWEEENDTLFKYQHSLFNKREIRYCYERWIPYGDRLLCETYIFSSKPTKKTINTIILLEKIKNAFRSKRMKHVYKCWECGHEKHWLDAEGNFEDKWNNLENKYCGC